MRATVRRSYQSGKKAGKCPRLGCRAIVGSQTVAQSARAAPRHSIAALPGGAEGEAPAAPVAGAPPEPGRCTRTDAIVLSAA